MASSLYDELDAEFKKIFDDPEGAPAAAAAAPVAHPPHAREHAAPLYENGPVMAGARGVGGDAPCAASTSSSATNPQPPRRRASLSTGSSRGAGVGVGAEARQEAPASNYVNMALPYGGTSHANGQRSPPEKRSQAMAGRTSTGTAAGAGAGTSGTTALPLPDDLEQWAKHAGKTDDTIVYAHIVSAQSLIAPASGSRITRHTRTAPATNALTLAPSAPVPHEELIYTTPEFEQPDDVRPRSHSNPSSTSAHASSSPVHHPPGLGRIATTPEPRAPPRLPPPPPSPHVPAGPSLSMPSSSSHQTTALAATATATLPRHRPAPPVPNSAGGGSAPSVISSPSSARPPLTPDWNPFFSLPVHPSSPSLPPSSPRAPAPSSPSSNLSSAAAPPLPPHSPHAPSTSSSSLQHRFARSDSAAASIPLSSHPSSRSDLSYQPHPTTTSSSTIPHTTSTSSLSSAPSAPPALPIQSFSVQAVYRGHVTVKVGSERDVPRVVCESAEAIAKEVAKMPPVRTDAPSDSSPLRVQAASSFKLVDVHVRSNGVTVEYHGTQSTGTLSRWSVPPHHVLYSAISPVDGNQCAIIALDEDQQLQCHIFDMRTAVMAVDLVNHVLPFTRSPSRVSVPVAASSTPHSAKSALTLGLPRKGMFPLAYLGFSELDPVTPHSFQQVVNDSFHYLHGQAPVRVLLSVEAKGIKIFSPDRKEFSTRFYTISRVRFIGPCSTDPHHFGIVTVCDSVVVADRMLCHVFGKADESLMATLKRLKEEVRAVDKDNGVFMK